LDIDGATGASAPSNTAMSVGRGEHLREHAGCIAVQLAGGDHADGRSYGLHG
jgi:hypothetical protein